MIELVIAILLLVIVALVGLIGWLDYNNRKERKTYLNALIAKDAGELANLDLADKTKVDVKPPEPPPYREMGDLDDEEFDKLIKEQLK